jgi:hypothetical protein
MPRLFLLRKRPPRSRNCTGRRRRGLVLPRAVATGHGHAALARRHRRESNGHLIEPPDWGAVLASDQRPPAVLVSTAAH